MFTYGIPEIDNIKTATFANDTALLAIGVNVKKAVQKLQRATDDFRA